MTSARDEILQRLRGGRSTGPCSAPPPLPAPRLRAHLSQPIAREQLVATFRGQLAQVGARAEVVARADLAARVAALLTDAEAHNIACSDAPLVRDALASLPASIETLPPDAARERLLACDTGISSAQWAVAETGTLVLASAHERHRLCSLLPDRYLALVPMSRLVGHLGDVFSRLHEPSASPTSRAITFVTGPSRTADIELQLVVGVHGPKDVAVLLVDDL